MLKLQYLKAHYILTHIQIHTYRHTHTHAHTHSYAHMHICVHAHTHTHTHTHTHIHTHTHTHCIVFIHSFVASSDTCACVHVCCHVWVQTIVYIHKLHAYIHGIENKSFSHSFLPVLFSSRNRYNCDCVLYVQVWRLVTNFLYFGPIGFNFLFNMIFAYRYCRMLEEGSFRGRSADFFFMFIFGGFLMIVSFIFSQSIILK